MTGTTWSLDGSALQVKIDGRVTAEAIETFRTAIQAGLDRPGSFTACFDRSAMTAPTKEGRAALETWAAVYLPQLAGRCAGWADVYDQRRMRSLTRTAGSDPSEEGEAAPYPQQLFGDVATARAWLRDVTSGGPSDLTV